MQTWNTAQFFIYSYNSNSNLGILKVAHLQDTAPSVQSHLWQGKGLNQGEVQHTTMIN